MCFHEEIRKIPVLFGWKKRLTWKYNIYWMMKVWCLPSLTTILKSYRALCNEAPYNHELNFEFCLQTDLNQWPHDPKSEALTTEPPRCFGMDVNMAHLSLHICAVLLGPSLFLRRPVTGTWTMNAMIMVRLDRCTRWTAWSMARYLSTPFFLNPSLAKHVMLCLSKQKPTDLDLHCLSLCEFLLKTRIK